MYHTNKGAAVAGDNRDLPVRLKRHPTTNAVHGEQQL